MTTVNYEINVGKKIRLIVEFSSRRHTIKDCLSYKILCYKEGKLVESGEGVVPRLTRCMRPYMNLGTTEGRADRMDTSRGYESAFELAIEAICDAIKMTTGRKVVCARLYDTQI